MPDPLRIGVVPGVTPDRWVRVWRQRRPEVRLEIVALPDDGAAAALPDRADMVFARLPVPGLDPDAAHVIPLWTETVVVVAARDSPVRAFDALTAADLAGEERREGWDEPVLDLVAAGAGVTTMPQAVFRATGRRDLVSRPLLDGEPTRIGLAWLRASGGPLVDEFIGVVRGRTANSSRG